MGTWQIDPKEFVFDKSLAEFRSQVSLQAARPAGDRIHQPLPLGAGREAHGRHAGPALLAHPHPQRGHGLSEPEHLEILVHELGHYLGAVHVPQGVSVMRPILGDQKSRLASFRIRFDAPNTLAMYLVAEQMRIHPIMSLAQLSPERKAVLRGVYTAIAQAMPDDPTSQHYLALVNMWAPPFPPPTRSRVSRDPRAAGRPARPAGLRDATPRSASAAGLRAN